MISNLVDQLTIQGYILILNLSSYTLSDFNLVGHSFFFLIIPQGNPNQPGVGALGTDDGLHILNAGLLKVFSMSDIALSTKYGIPLTDSSNLYSTVRNANTIRTGNID